MPVCLSIAPLSPPKTNASTTPSKLYFGRSHCGSVEMNLMSIHEDAVRSQASRNGLGILHCCELWSPGRLGSHVAVVSASSCNSDSTPSLGGISMCHGCSFKKKRKKKKKAVLFPLDSYSDLSIPGQESSIFLLISSNTLNTSGTHLFTYQNP